ncbi:hypothetical protein [Pedobacter cryoconitis]|uniref:Uncharacterized protein n=1 Tax=Pedobacter cryoconitis TaxID=188932 RepID=A0A327SCX4_9SPHI|nr:hypothetical protein [Pedobacter cryoconitis]RAJ26929.1 hypothetical protein LY11_03755 [Pedobacter cryoconitis]
MKRGNNFIKQLGVFFTKKDEIELSNLLRLQFQNIFFIDTSRSDSKEIKFIDDLSLGFKGKSILNTDIFSLEDYKTLVNSQDGPHFSFPMIGKGLIQYVSSEVAGYDPKCLKDGYFGGSYNVSDELTANFVKQFFKLVGQYGRKVYLVSRTRDLCADVPEKQLLVWPDAAKIYNGENQKYLTQTRERWLVPEEVG